LILPVTNFPLHPDKLEPSGGTLTDWDEVRKLDSLRRSGHPAEALDELQRTRVTCADNEARASILLNESLCLCDLSRFAEAVETVSTALQLLAPESPSHPYAEFSLACAHQLNGQLELAAQEFRAFLQQHQELLNTGDHTPLRRDAQHRLAATLITLGQSTEPLFLLEVLKAEATSPSELSELHYREAEVNVIMGRQPRALELFQQALGGALDLRFVARAHFGIGEILFQRNEFQLALVEFETAEQLGTRNTPDHDAYVNWLRATRAEIQKISLNTAN
jgi:tetratricopeptide (TPR) repeat protein